MTDEPDQQEAAAAAIGATTTSPIIAKNQSPQQKQKQKRGGGGGVSEKAKVVHRALSDQKQQEECDDDFDDDDDVVVISRPPPTTSSDTRNNKGQKKKNNDHHNMSRNSPEERHTAAVPQGGGQKKSSLAPPPDPNPVIQRSISSEEDDEDYYDDDVQLNSESKTSKTEAEAAAAAEAAAPFSTPPRRLQARAQRRRRSTPPQQQQQAQSTATAAAAAVATATSSSSSILSNTNSAARKPTPLLQKSTVSRTTAVSRTNPNSKLPSASDGNDGGDASGYWSVDEEEQGTNTSSSAVVAVAAAVTGGGGLLSREDIQVCQQLDAEYEEALEEREVGYAARYNSVRQSACFSVFFMVIYLTLGTMFFVRQAAESDSWSVSDSLLFSIYTITTVGYGHLVTPETPVFQLYTIFFIFIGIATLTIMVAQVYQCIALEASRAQHSRDQSELARRGMDMLIKTTMIGRRRDASSSSSSPSSQPSSAVASAAIRGEAIASSSSSPTRQEDDDIIDMPPEPWVDRVFRALERIKIFFVTNEFGRSISVLFPFAGLILLGAIVIGPIEGWTPIEAIYFSVVSLTTVGFGDYYPTHRASVCFCIIWLPFSIGFMSLFLANVAAFYIRLSDKNIERIERHLRRRITKAKVDAEREKREARRRALRGQEPRRRPPVSIEMGTTSSAAVGTMDTEDGFDGEDNSNHSKSSDENARDLFSTQANWTRRERVLHNSRRTSDERRIDGNDSDDSGETIQPRGSRMDTMKAVIKTVYANMSTGSSNAFRAGPDAEFLSVRSNQKLYKHSLRGNALRKPSFALRVLVQERLAEIIATEIAGNQSNVEIKDNTLSVTINVLKQTADKWLIPRRARKAFRSVSFEALYFVGEHGLITRGADALYDDLTPFEFHGLFAPFLAALGDAETMESWLASTEILAEVDLRGKDSSSSELQPGSHSQPNERQLRRHGEARGRTRRGGRRTHDSNENNASADHEPTDQYQPITDDKGDHAIV